MRCHSFAALFLVPSWLPIAVSIQTFARTEQTKYMIDASGEYKLFEETESLSSRRRRKSWQKQQAHSKKSWKSWKGHWKSEAATPSPAPAPTPGTPSPASAPTPASITNAGTPAATPNAPWTGGSPTPTPAPTKGTLNATTPASPAPTSVPTLASTPETMNIVIGGQEREDNIEVPGSDNGEAQWGSTGNIMHRRPEGVKSYACDSNGCHSCSDREKCFHGESAKGWGYLAISVPKGASFTHYTAEVWVHCSNGNGSWQLYSQPCSNGYRCISNGKLDVSLDKEDGQVVEVLSKWTPTIQKCHGCSKIGEYVDIPGLQKGKSRIRIAFHPDKKSKAAMAWIWLAARGVDVAFDECTDMKACLRTMGDGTPESFELRNVNDVQKKCLQGDTASMSIALQQKCWSFTQCLEASGRKSMVLGLLGGATMASSAPTTENLPDARDCINPSTDDPESWDCACSTTWTAKCQEPQNAAKPLETCLNEVMCSNRRICCSWKQGHCPTESRCSSAAAVDTISSSHGSALIRRSSANTSLQHAGSTQQSKHSMDDTLQDKCTG